MATSIVLSRKRAKNDLEIISNEKNELIVTPGDRITSASSVMKGHGTYVENDELVACLGGLVKRVNQLVFVNPLKCVYNGEVGDIVVGRIIEVQQKRWKVDLGCRLDAILPLRSLNLPGGEQRKRGEEDELMMRQYLREGDIISAAVYQVHSDGSLSLHTRSLKYDKLTQGVLIRVNSSLIKQQKTHFHSFSNAVAVILGNNGQIWIGPMTEESSDDTGGEIVHNLEPVMIEARQTIARLRSCILALAAHHMLIYETSILYVYEAAADYQCKELLKPDIMNLVIKVAKIRLQTELS
ncbi:Exosome complex component RRP4 [Chamberlinius hualienensis]